MNKSKIIMITLSVILQFLLIIFFKEIYKIIWQNPNLTLIAIFSIISIDFFVMLNIIKLSFFNKN